MSAMVRLTVRRGELDKADANGMRLPRVVETDRESYRPIAQKAKEWRGGFILRWG